jgi:hypothetical protein
LGPFGLLSSSKIPDAKTGLPPALGADDPQLHAIKEEPAGGAGASGMGPAGTSPAKPFSPSMPSNHLLLL